jgi:hypothetical protein
MDEQDEGVWGNKVRTLIGVFRLLDCNIQTAFTCRKILLRDTNVATQDSRLHDLLRKVDEPRRNSY